MHLLRMTHLLHLALRDSSTVVDDACGLESGRLVELNEELSHHVGEILDDFLAVELLLGQVLAWGLHSHGGTIAAGVPIHATHHSRNGRFLPIACRWVSDIGPQKDDRLLEHGGPDGKQTQTYEGTE